MNINVITTEIGDALKHFAEPQSLEFDEEKRFCEAVWAIVQKRVAAEREACAEIAEDHKPTGPTGIGPLFGAGIYAAADAIAKAIRMRANVENVPEGSGAGQWTAGAESAGVEADERLNGRL